MTPDEQIKEWQIRRYDPSGRLIEAGFRWFEVRPLIYNLFTWLNISLVIVSVIVFVGAIVAAVNGAILAAAIAFALSLLGAYAFYKFEQKSKKLGYQWIQVAFSVNDEILMSDKSWRDVNEEPSIYAMDKSLESLISIEAAPSRAIGGGHGHVTIQGQSMASYIVQLVFNDGQVRVIAHTHTLESDTRLIAVQLNLALQEIRQVIATHNREAAMGRAPRGYPVDRRQ